MFLPAMVYDPEFEVGTSNLERYCANMAGRNVSVLILYNNESKILLQHRTKDAPTFPDYWAFFGGGIEEGESAEQAVKRESLEELGYELTGPRLPRCHRQRTPNNQGMWEHLSCDAEAIFCSHC